jgi:hypothetical protein
MLFLLYHDHVRVNLIAEQSDAACEYHTSYEDVTPLTWFTVTLDTLLKPTGRLFASFAVRLLFNPAGIAYIHCLQVFVAVNVEEGAIFPLVPGEDV